MAAPDDRTPAPRVLTMDIYARLSRAVDGETIKVEDQIEQCTEEILARGARVGEVFRDNSLSAWQPNVVRPDWQRLMARLEAGESDGVMVYDLYRFSRKVIEGERLITAAESGTRVWALAGEYRLTTADGRAAFREAMVKAATESDKTSERVRRGNLRRARSGRPSGRGRTWAMPGWAPKPDGWEKGDPRSQVDAAVVEAERAVARECIERLVAGEALNALAVELNERGKGGERACLTVAGGMWSATTLSRSLRRPAMAGLLHVHGEIVGGLARIEPVVDREMWERLCALFDARRTGRPPSPRHLLSGLMVCAECGQPMRPHLRSGQDPYPDGEVRRDYRCRRVDGTDRACGRNYIDGRVAERAVGAAVVERLSDPRRADRVAARLARVGEQRALIEADIVRWEAEADALAGKTATWGVARVDRSMAPILGTIERLRTDLAGLDVPDTREAATADAVAAWHDAQARGDVDVMRRLVRSAFPDLALALPSGRGDHSPTRMLWNGVPPTAPTS